MSCFLFNKHFTFSFKFHYHDCGRLCSVNIFAHPRFVCSSCLVSPEVISVDCGRYLPKIILSLLLLLLATSIFHSDLVHHQHQVLGG